MKYLSIVTKLNMDNRPKVLDTETSQLYPIATFDDLRETLELMERTASSVRPYIVKWYNDVFIPTFRDQEGRPNELKVSDNLTLIERHVGNY